MTCIVVGSAFRNAAGKQVNRWLDQVADLKLYMSRQNIYVRAIAVEGDSRDNTRGELLAGAVQRRLSVDVRKCNHDGPVYTSTENRDRMANLSKVGNAILDGVSADDDFMLYVESDLIWDNLTVRGLMDNGLDAIVALDAIIAPLVFAGENFYDVYAFRGLDGNRFAPFPPYHESLANNDELSLTEVSSVGSCLMMPARIARQCRMRNEGAIVDFCADARSTGAHIFVDPNLRVEHPV